MKACFRSFVRSLARSFVRSFARSCVRACVRVYMRTCVKVFLEVIPSFRRSFFVFAFLALLPSPFRLFLFVERKYFRCREKGGAYGSGAKIGGGIFSFFSYR